MRIFEELQEAGDRKKVARVMKEDTDIRSTVSALAYSLWIERGCPSGTSELDWLRAENLIHKYANNE
jgi:hypothetical protein